jgi:hypothetical protein
MGKGLFFWIIMIIWFIFGWFRDDPRIGPYGGPTHNFMLFALLFLLGWHAFGFVIQ